MMGFNRGLWLTAAATLVFAACGNTGGDTDAGNGCTSDANCATGKVCHPVLKECVVSCTAGADCPSSAKNCAKFDGTPGSTSAPGFCQCATDALCQVSIPGNVCMAATKQCSAKCTATTGCPSGSTCNTTTGQCSGGSTTDAGTDAGMTMDAGTTTDAGTTSDAGVMCDFTTQPDICGYGSFCTAAHACSALSDGTCSNVSARPAWSAASTGPVIYDIIDEAVDVAADCTAGLTPFTTTVFAYAPAGSTFPAMKSALPGFFYYSSSGTATDIPTNLLKQSNYTTYANGTVMSAKFTLCSSTATTMLTAGFGFTNGNSACAPLTH